MRKLFLSKKASSQLNKLLQYLEVEWSTKVKNDFIKKLDKSFTLIKTYPQSCPETSYLKGIYMIVITKQTSAFYKYDDKLITILSIFDTRMNPEKRNKSL